MTTPTHRLVHIGIGRFSRAHTLPLTQRAGGWSVEAFTGRSPDMARTLEGQGCTYGLIVRGADGDDVELIDVLDAVHPGDNTDALNALLSDPATAVVTLTITEKGYSAGTDPATSAVARVAAALQARRAAGVEEPIALVSCDNLTGNGDVLRAALSECLDEDDHEWFDAHVDVVSTMVDRITPSADDGAAAVVAEHTGFTDAAPVVTEPFWEWVVEDAFRGPRPAWETVGVQMVQDVTAHEKRKLRLLNGAHSLMAYAGQVTGCERVDEAIAHRDVRALVEALWSEAKSTLELPVDELDAYTRALEERFRNPRLADQLIRIAADGSEKLRVRALPVIAELGGPQEAPGEVAALAAWTTWTAQRVRDGLEVADPRADGIAEAARLEDDAQRVEAQLSLLGVEDDQALVDAVLAQEERLASLAAAR